MTTTIPDAGIPRPLRTLFETQLQQFGVDIHPDGEAWSGSGRSAYGHGSVWGLPVGEHCIVFSHEVHINREMTLIEAPGETYACVCLVSEDTKATMPRMVDSPRALLDGSLYSFVQPAGTFTGPLRAGGTYSSRAICFLPGYFDELNRQWPGTFDGMFERFGQSWDEADSRTIMTTLLGTGPQHGPGSALLIRSRVEQMVSTLAASRGQKEQARRKRAAREQNGLAIEAQAAIERMLDEGRAPTLDEIAARLFVSRSHLCSAFTRETGKSIGHYAKERRIERAKTMLASGDAVAQVAARLGWPRCSAFSQAFKQATGTSPTEWRDNNAC